MGTEMAATELTRSAILATLEEYDTRGAEAFLALYGYGKALSYFLLHEGKQYDSKAIFGVAHKHVSADGRPLSNTDFSGGEIQVARPLEALGFKVTRPDESQEFNSRNPPWTRDELILALDLYMSNPASPPGKTSPQVAELSSLLKYISERLSIAVNPDYRNANGVYMKMMNFRQFDPAFREEGKTGLTRGNKLDEVIWNEFAHRPDHLRVVAALIRSTVTGHENWLQAPEDGDSIEAQEGRIITRLHRSRERDRSIVDRKKKLVLKRLGKLQCEACSFDFHAKYGERGYGFIEVHHTKPLHTLGDGTPTRLEDLALLCANCHRMVHSRQPWLTTEQLQSIAADALATAACKTEA